MMAALDPLGLPLVSQVVPGNHADDPLYIPAIDQVLKIIDGIGLLFVGDCKMSALAIRAHIQHLNHHYLCPLAMTGSMASEIVQWIEGGPEWRTYAAHAVYVESAQGERKLLAEGYAFERTVKDQVAGVMHEWLEQVFIVRSESYRHVLQEHLEERLQRAAAQIMALTPAPGQRQTPNPGQNAFHQHGHSHPEAAPGRRHL